MSLSTSAKIEIQASHSNEITTEFKIGLHFCPKYNQSFERDAFVVWRRWSYKFKNLRDVRIETIWLQAINQRLSAKTKEQFEIWSSRYRCWASHILKICIRLNGKSKAFTYEVVFQKNVIGTASKQISKKQSIMQSSKKIN